jgi:hypothetical protein
MCVFMGAGKVWGWGAGDMLAQADKKPRTGERCILPGLMRVCFHPYVFLASHVCLSLSAVHLHGMSRTWDSPMHRCGHMPTPPRTVLIAMAPLRWPLCNGPSLHPLQRPLCWRRRFRARTTPLCRCVECQCACQVGFERSIQTATQEHPSHHTAGRRSRARAGTQRIGQGVYLACLGYKGLFCQQLVTCWQLPDLIILTFHKQTTKVELCIVTRIAVAVSKFLIRR